MPEIDHRTGQRLAGRIENTALQEHHGGDIVFATVIHARDALGDWRAGDIQRTLDGAWGAADQAFLFVLGVLQQVEVMLQSESGDQQAGFVATAETVDVVHRLPELVLGDFQVFDDPCGVRQDAVDHRLQAAATRVVVEAAGFLEELLHVVGVGDFHSHGSGLVL